MKVVFKSVLILSSVIMICYRYVSAQELCINNSYSIGRWKPTNRSEKSFYCCDNGDVGKIPSCGSHTINYDGYLEYNELYVASQLACSCDSVENTRNTVNQREKYEWVPDSCILEPFRGEHFCELLGDRRILLIGDSLMHQVATVIIKILQFQNASCIGRIRHGKHVFVGRNWAKTFHTFFDHSHGADICIVNAGSHLGDEGDLLTVWDALPKWQKELEVS